MALILGLLGWLVSKLQSLVPRPKLTILYQGNRLDGRDIILAKGIKPTVRPAQMQIDPNIPNLFCLEAIGIGNEGKATGHIQYAYLDFSAPVNPSRYGAPWGPDTEGTEFIGNWGGQSINPHQPAVGLPGFCAMPIPNHQLKVKLRILYDDDAEEANFTISLPD